MKTLLACIYFLLVSACAWTQQDTAYVRTFGGVAGEEAREVQECSTGGYVVVGTTGSDQDLNSNIYLLKLDEHLQCLWSRDLGQQQIERGYSLVEDAEGNWLVAGFSNSDAAQAYDVVVYKVSPDGETLWRKYYGGADWDFGYRIVKHPVDGFLLCGETYSSGSGEKDAYVIWINNDGDVVQEATFGDVGDDGFFDVVTNGTDLYWGGYKTVLEPNEHTVGWIVQTNLILETQNETIRDLADWNYKIEGLDWGNDQVWFTGYRDSMEWEFAVRGSLEADLDSVRIYEDRAQGNNSCHEIVHLYNDTTSLAGSISYFGAGGKDAISYFLRQNDFIGAPTFGNNFNDEFFDVIFTSDSALVNVGVARMDITQQPQMLVVKQTHMKNGDYVQVFMQDVGCFAVGVEESSFAPQSIPNAYELYNLEGKKVHACSAGSFDVRGLAEGLYVRIALENGAVVGREKWFVLPQ
jgi:hypothetical protein